MMASERVIRRRSQGRMRKLRKPSITIWPAMVPVSVEDWPEQSSATAKMTPARLGPEQRRQQHVRLLDFRDHDAALEEHRRRQHQDGGIHQQGAVQRHHANRSGCSGRRVRLSALGVADAARLHQRRMQVQIVRHHRGAQDADGHVQAVAD